MLYSSRGKKLCDLVRKELIEDLKKENPTIKIEDLTTAETKMFYAAARGGNAKCALRGPTLSSLSEWDCWNDWNVDRLVRAEVLRWLCTTTEALKLVDPRGIHIRDALIKRVCKPEREGDLDVDLDSTKIPFSFYLWQCAIPGGIQLRDAKIGGLLALVGCHTKEVRIDRIEAGGDVWLGTDPDPDAGGSSGFRATEKISALGSNISGDLHLEGGEIPSVSLMGATIGGSLNLQGAKIKEIDLTGACIASLEDSCPNWPVKGKLHLKGFRYKAIASITSPTDAYSRLEWLRLQPSDDLHSPQPYEQLAGVLHEMGYRSEAKHMLYEKEDMLCKWKRYRGSWFRKLRGLAVGSLWKRVVGYGYYPEWAFYWLVIFFLIGVLVFKLADSANVMCRSKVDANESNRMPDLHR